MSEDPMSLKDQFPSEIPEDTRQLVERLVSEDSVYRLLGQKADEILSDADFVEMYDEEGRPAINPVLLSLVVVFQFLEKLPDRQAADMAVMRLDWKYALRQQLDWQGFHYSDLCNFRKRLGAKGQERLVFERVVVYLREQGYLKSGGKQRTDSSRIIANVMRLSRLELIWETLRLTMSALISSDVPWTLRYIPSSFTDTHARRRSDFRLNKEEVKAALEKAGQEGYWLLEQLRLYGTETLQSLTEVEQLRRVLDEQYDCDEQGQVTKLPAKDCSGDVLTTPHDPDVRYGNKGGQDWVGYTLQVTETVSEDEALRFITDIEVTSTRQQDNEALRPIQQRLENCELLPEQQYVDQGYMSGANLQSSLDMGIDLRGLIRKGNVSKAEGFRLSDFEIDIDRRRAICPAGKRSVKWARAKPGVKNLIAYHVSFGKQCQTCAFFCKDLCTDKPTGRKLGISAHHHLIQARRQEAQTEGFRQEMHHRAGIEACISELVRSHGARRSRYRGLVRNRLQASFIAVATNLKRLARASLSRLAFKFWVLQRFLVLSNFLTA